MRAARKTHPHTLRSFAHALVHFSSITEEPEMQPSWRKLHLTKPVPREAFSKLHLPSVSTSFSLSLSLSHLNHLLLPATAFPFSSFCLSWRRLLYPQVPDKANCLCLFSNAWHERPWREIWSATGTESATRGYSNARAHICGLICMWACPPHAGFILISGSFWCHDDNIAHSGRPQTHTQVFKTSLIGKVDQ